MTATDGFAIRRDVVAHGPAGPCDAWWAWHPNCPATVRLLVVQAGGELTILSFARATLLRIVNCLSVTTPPDPECWVRLGVHDGHRVLTVRLTPHTNPDPPWRGYTTRRGRHTSDRSWSTPAADTVRFLAATTRAMPVCPQWPRRCPIHTPCQECRYTRAWVVGLAEHALTETTPPPPTTTEEHPA